MPDDSPGEQGFAFDRFGVRIPSIVISPFTERGTVIADQFHSTSVLRTMRERLDLGPALTRRDAAAPLLDVAFNRSEPRTDALASITPPSVAAIDHSRGDEPGDAPDAKLLLHQRREARKQHVSQLGAATLRNAARLVGDDPDDVPQTAGHARRWLDERFSFLRAATPAPTREGAEPAEARRGP